MTKPTTTAEKLDDLYLRLEKANEPGSDRAIARRTAKGIPSARERIAMLLDPGSFIEIGKLAKMEGDSPYGDGVVVGHGTVDGRPVGVFSHDQTVYGGTVGEMFGRKVSSMLEWCAKVGCPVVGINDSGGARIQDAVTSLVWYAKLGAKQEDFLGRVPTISMILGKCAGGAVYAPANTEMLVSVKDRGYMFVTGPEVLKKVTGEDVTLDELGGAIQQGRAGNLHHVAETEEDAFEYVRQLLSFLPSNSYEKPPHVPTFNSPTVTDYDRELNSIIPDADNQGYNIFEVIEHLVDDGEFLEYADLWAPNIVCGFARIDGEAVAIVANQPMYMSGVLDIDSAEKATRFIRMCNSYNLPFIFLVDVPGFLPGVEQERNAIIRRGGKFLCAYVEATVPKITIVLRKAYGGGFAVMGSKQLGADFSFAWPTARIAVMGAESAVTIIKKAEIDAAGPEEGKKIRDAFIAFYNQFLATPYLAAERGYIDAVIKPEETRTLIAQSLRQLKDKRRIDYPRKLPTIPV